MCFRLGDAAVFTGDFVFVRSVGRPDLGGKQAEWTAAAVAQLGPREGDVVADARRLPAHYASESERNADFTVGCEFGVVCRNNEPLAIEDESEFGQWVRQRTGGVPDAYRRIKAINLGLESVDEVEADELEAGRTSARWVEETMPYRMAMFDFDGTLMDTQGAITRPFLATMDAVGVPRPTEAEVVGCIGMALPAALAQFAGPSHDVDHLCATYREIFSRCAPGHTTPFEGVRELLEDLDSDGVALAVTTNRSRRSAVDMLEEHGMLGLFRSIVGGTCVPRPKPDPEMLHRVLDEASNPCVGGR